METNGFGVNVMKFSDFISLCNLISRIYGTSIARDFFKKNAGRYYNLDVDKAEFEAL